VLLISIDNDVYAWPQGGAARLNPCLAEYPMCRPALRRSQPRNIPIGPDPSRPAPADMIATLGTRSRRQDYSETSRFSFAVYFADASTPRYNVFCTRFRCTVIDAKGVSTRQRVLEGVPIPIGAQPSPGDNLMIVVDTASGIEYGLFHPVLTRRGWETSNGYEYPVLSDAAPIGFHSRAAASLKGLIRPWEIRYGEIHHAIAFAYPFPSDHACVYPATRAVDTVTMENAIPLGARLQLNPDLTEEDFDRWGLTRAGRIVARAMQEYGMILVDNSGAPKIYAEDLANNPFRLESWADPDLFYTRDLVADIPYHEFRVLALPDAYWAPQDAPSELYGKCLITPSAWRADEQLRD
jgi:hypothetical protein